MKLLKNLQFLIENQGEDNSVYQGLKDYLEGKITSYQLERYDNLFYGIKDSKSGNKKLSTIIIKFPDIQDYFKTFDLGDDDEHFVSALFSYYSDSLNIYDSYYTDEDWNDGRITRYYFNDENKNLLREIIKIIDPKWYKVSVDDWDTEILKKIDKLFDREIDTIKSDFSMEMNNSYENAMKTEIRNDFGNLFQDYGLYLKNEFYTYYTSPYNLIELYDEFDPTKKKTLHELLTIIGQKISPDGGFWDQAHQIDTSREFDDEGFNRQVNWELEKIMDKISDEDNSDYYNFKEFKEIIDKLMEKFEFNEWYVLPVNTAKSFKINEIDPESNKIKISVKNNAGGLSQNYLLNLDNFYSLLYNYNLFN